MPARNGLLDAVPDAVEAFRRALAGEKRPVVLVDIEVTRFAAFRVGARKQQGRHAGDVAASRAAISFSHASLRRTSTLPPMWPHFFTAGSWSPKCTPAAPASIIARISS